MSPKKQIIIICICLILPIMIGGFFYFFQKSFTIIGTISEVIAGSIQGQKKQEETRTGVILKNIINSRYFYTLAKEIEGQLQQSGIKVTLATEDSAFGNVYEQGNDYIFSLPNLPEVRITKNLFFFKKEGGLPLSLSTVSGEGNQGKPVISKKKVIALTFDDGPSSKYTPMLLDILKREGIRATFFVLGSQAEGHPDILKREQKEGHEIGNHSYSHKLFTKLSEREIQEEIYKTDQAIYAAIGEYPTLLRPPYGGVNEDILRIAHMPIILWSIDTLDWKTKNKAKNIASVHAAQNGDIIIMHDIHKTSIESIEGVIQFLKAKGFIFVTVSELLELSGEHQENGKKCTKKGHCK